VIKHFGWLGVIMLALSMCVASACAREQAPADADHASAAHATGEPDPHEPPLTGDRPIVPTDAAAWAGTMLIIVIAMFLMAAVIGPMVRMEVPVESHHDDHANDHGHSHGHGH
jgi:hypothetical protein